MESLFDPNQFINLTPHDVHIHTEDGVNTIPRHNDRGLRTQIVPPQTWGNLYGVKLYVPMEHDGFEPEDRKLISEINRTGLHIICSELAARELIRVYRNRMNVCILVPHSGPGMVVRDDQGRIMGVRGLQLFYLSPNLRN